MSEVTPGLHHVSAIVGDPQSNVRFYAEVLGLRLVKQTVNFDDTFVYHLYYGDETGSPGTLITFFPYQQGTNGRIGKPQPTATAFTVPENAVQYWRDRLERSDATLKGTTERFGETVISFQDHDGLPLELIARKPERPPAGGPIPSEHAIRGLHSVTLLSSSTFHTAATLEVLGVELTGQEGSRVRYRVPGNSTNSVDLLDEDASYGRGGIGTIHHVAFRAGEQSLEAWRRRLEDAGLEPTWIRDRHYFESIYFREPGGILFELASDGPGFTVDESRSELGTTLQLPPQYEPDREMITQQLPELSVPEG